MSGILQRLVARANGTASDGLRPHIPARFEESPQGGTLQEHHTAVSVKQEPAPQIDSGMLVRPQKEVIAARPPLADPPSASREVVQASHPRPQPIQSVAPPLVTTETSPRQQTPAPVPPPRLTPSLPDQEEGPDPVEANPADAQAPAPRAVDAVIPDTMPLPPHPLLPPAAEQAPINDLPVGIASKPVSPATAEAGQISDEVTIEIGQLDIRVPAPASPPVKTARPTVRNLPSLSDYLRGNGS